MNTVVLLAGYILFTTCLNVIALLISSFYKKKFNYPAPQAVFVLSVVLAFFSITSLFYNGTNELIKIISLLTLAGSGASSAIGSFGLFFTMRKVRK